MVCKSTLRRLVFYLIFIALFFPLTAFPVYASKNAPLSKHILPSNAYSNSKPLTTCQNTNGDDCPTWWSNTPCDSINHKNGTGEDSAILFDTKTGKKAIYNGIEACGPLPRKIGNSHDYYVSFYPGGPQEQEWECTELVKRYLYEVFRVHNLGNTNGSQVVSNYYQAYSNIFNEITNGTSGVFPQIGDVLSYGDPTKTAGHTSIVTDLTITDKIKGNGSITIIDENGFASGQGKHTITSWFVDGTNDGGNQITAWLTPKIQPQAWNVVPSLNPPVRFDQLYGVAAVSASDVWTVGSYQNSNGTYKTLIEQWNGTNWSVVHSPNIGMYDNELYGVAAVSANDVWAVGRYYNFKGADYQTLTEHWNGTKWTIVPSLNISTIGESLYGVAVDSTSDVWAVGYSYNKGNGYPNQTLIEHWNGTSWSVVPSINPSQYNELYGVVAVSASDVWAVGYYVYPNNQGPTLIEHWNGTSWSVVPSPNASTYNYLFGLTAISASDIWAVGFDQSSNSWQTLIEQWNGTSWSVVPSPNPSTSSNSLYGVAAVSANDVWAVGNYQDSNGIDQTLIEQWNGTSWSDVPSPNVSTYNNDLYGVATVSANDAWAVGQNDAGTLTEHYT